MAARDDEHAGRPGLMTSASAAFGERVLERVRARRSSVVLGLDPDVNRLWPGAVGLLDRGELDDDPAVVAAAAVGAQCVLAIDATAEHCVAAKLQLACFERFGAAGWEALARVTWHARERGLLVIADGKRGDIDVSARGYGEALFGGSATPFGHARGLEVDAATVNPLVGPDGLRPMLDLARASGAGLFVLVRTSNPGAAHVQDLELASGGTVSSRIAELVAELGSDGVGPGGLSDVGAVTGATAPEQLARLRELMPETVFLLPGVGAQGGSVQALGPAFAPGPAGGLVSSSRGIVNAFEATREDPAVAANREAARLRKLVWELAA